MFLEDQIHPFIKDLNQSALNRADWNKGGYIDFISRFCHQVEHLEKYIKSSLNNKFIAGEILIYDFFERKSMVSLYQFYKGSVKGNGQFHRQQPVFGNLDDLQAISNVLKVLYQKDQLFANKLREAKEGRKTIMAHYDPSMKSRVVAGAESWINKYIINDIHSLNTYLNTSFSDNYLKLIQNGLSKNTNTFTIIYIPAILQNQEAPINFWGIYETDSLFKLEDKFLLDFIFNIQTYLILFFSQLLSIAFDQRFNQVYYSAVKSAIAKVMARNMSHNIGSHVLSRLVHSQSITQNSIVSDKVLQYHSIKESSPKELRDKRIKENYNKLIKEWEPVLGKISSADRRNSLLELIREKASKSYYDDLISYFFSYLKTRQDLLADIVTGIPQVQSTKWFAEELVDDLDKNRLLLNRISGVDDFKYNFDLTGLVCKCLEVCDECKVTRDIQIAISNDIMGQHAFYIILENIIRNTAKHGQLDSQSNNGRQYVFMIEVNESSTDPSFYQVTVSDDVNIEGYSYLRISNLYRPSDLLATALELKLEDEQVFEIEKGKEQYYLDRLGEDIEYVGTGISGSKTYDYYRISNIDKLILQQNIWINEPILYPDSFDLRQGALGLIEMEVCTAYLRRVPVEDIEAKEFEIKFSPSEIETTKKNIRAGKERLRLLRAVKVRNTVNSPSGSLGYRFYLPKPKEVLIIDQEGILWNSFKVKDSSSDKFHRFKSLESNGILLLNAVGAYSDDEWHQWRYNPELVYQHELLVIVGNEEKEDLNFAKLPHRWISYQESEFLFNVFQTKHEERNQRIRDFVKRRGTGSPSVYDIYFDLINYPKETIVEFWRAYLTKRHRQKGLSLHPVKSINFYKLLIDHKFGNVHFPSFDHHGKNYWQWAENWDKGKCIGCYKEIFDSRFKDYVNKIESPDSPDNLLLKLQFLDASLSNIMVIDERIQEQAYSQPLKLEGGQEINIAKAWNHANVYIPNQKELNLGTKTFSNDYADKIIHIIDKQFGADSFRQCKGIDIIIIHLGVIEKVLEQARGKSKDNPKHINEFVESISKQNGHHAQVVLTSGRAPTNLSKELPFLSYSVISQYIIEYRFKLMLNAVLNAARPKI